MAHVTEPPAGGQEGPYLALASVQVLGKRVVPDELAEQANQMDLCAQPICSEQQSAEEEEERQDEDCIAYKSCPVRVEANLMFAVELSEQQSVTDARFLELETQRAD